MHSKKKPTANDIDEKIGQNLKELRILRGFSQAELGDLSGVTFQQIQKYENGSNRISASRLYKFSKILDFPVQAFFNGITGVVSAAVLAQTPTKYVDMIEMLEELNDPKIEKVIKNILKTYSDESESD